MCVVGVEDKCFVDFDKVVVGCVYDVDGCWVEMENGGEVFFVGL